MMRLPTMTAEEAAGLLSGRFPWEYHAEELQYYAWPQAFGSTAGPFGGIGGQMITTFTIEAWTDGRAAVLFCGARVLKVVGNFQPLMRV